MKKILAFNGSPRKGGNTEVLLDHVLQGVAAAGGEYELFRLNDLVYKPCQNCGGCDKKGVCVLNDDITPLYDKIIATDRVIIASPIYFYGVSAQTKAFIDRMQAMWNRKRLLKEQGKWQENKARKGYFLSVAATGGPKIFEGAVLAVKYGFDAMDMAYAGELLIRGVDLRGEMAKRKEELAAAVEFGKKIVTD